MFLPLSKTLPIVSLFLILLVPPTFPQAEEVNTCDLYAGHPNDPTLVEGVVFEDLDPEKAIPACEFAVGQFPDTVRFVFQLGRGFQKIRTYDFF